MPWGRAIALQLGCRAMTEQTTESEDLIEQAVDPAAARESAG